MLILLQEWEGLDNIPKKGGALIIYYHGVSTGRRRRIILQNKFYVCRLSRLTIAPRLGRSGLKKADAFPVLSIGLSHSYSSLIKIFFMSFLIIFQIHSPFQLKINRSLMEIPGLDPVREHFNLFPGTRESCIELLK